MLTLVGDLLGSLELGDPMATDDMKAAAAKHAEAARKLREKLIAANMTPPETGSTYWYYATLAEAYLGLHDLDNAEQALTKAVMDLVGDDVLMYASDYPHGESHYPETVGLAMAWDLSEARRRKLMWDNAVKLYARAGLA